MLSATKNTTPLKRKLSTGLGAAVLALSVICAGASQASAQGACMKHVEISNLLKKHKEAQVAIGLASNGNLIEVFSTGNGATWSIVMTDPRGTSCIVAAGKDWDHRAQIVLGQAS